MVIILDQLKSNCATTGSTVSTGGIIGSNFKNGGISMIKYVTNGGTYK